MHEARRAGGQLTERGRFSRNDGSHNDVLVFSTHAGSAVNVHSELGGRSWRALSTSCLLQLNTVSDTHYEQKTSRARKSDLCDGPLSEQLDVRLDSP